MQRIINYFYNFEQNSQSSQYSLPNIYLTFRTLDPVLFSQPASSLHIWSGLPDGFAMASFQILDISPAVHTTASMSILAKLCRL
jgi:hypothetical protein